MENTGKSFRIKIVALAITSLIVFLEFNGILYFLATSYFEKNNIQNSSELTQPEKISTSEANKLIQNLLKWASKGKIAFYDSGDAVNVAQVIQKGAKGAISSSEMNTLTKATRVLSETPEGQQALEEAGISLNGKKIQQGHSVYEDTVAASENKTVKINDSEIPIVNKDQFQAGEAKYLPALDDVQKQQIHESSLELAKWAQESVPGDGVLGGSFIPSVLANAQKIEVLNAAGEVQRTVELTESAKNSFLNAITRNPKDVDIIIQSSSKEAANLTSRDIPVSELPEKARGAFTSEQETFKLDVIPIDRLESRWRVTTSNGDIREIPAIDEAIAAKTLYAPTSNVIGNNTLKYNSDFENLWNVAKSSGYSDEELYAKSKDAFKKYLETNDSTELAKNVDGLLNRNSISPQLKDWLGKLREDPEVFPEKIAREAESLSKTSEVDLNKVAAMAAIGWGENDSDDPAVPEAALSDREQMASIPYTPGQELAAPTDSDFAGVANLSEQSPSWSIPSMSWDTGMNLANNILESGTIYTPLGVAALFGTAAAAPFVTPAALTAGAVAGVTLMAVDGIKKMYDDPSMLKQLPGNLEDDAQTVYNGIKNWITNPPATDLTEQTLQIPSDAGGNGSLVANNVGGDRAAAIPLVYSPTQDQRDSILSFEKTIDQSDFMKGPGYYDNLKKAYGDYKDSVKNLADEKLLGLVKSPDPEEVSSLTRNNLLKSDFFNAAQEAGIPIDQARKVADDLVAQAQLGQQAWPETAATSGSNDGQRAAYEGNRGVPEYPDYWGTWDTAENEKKVPWNPLPSPDTAPPVPDKIANQTLPPVLDVPFGQQDYPTEPLPAYDKYLSGNGTMERPFEFKDSEEAYGIIDRISDIDPRTGEAKLKDGWENDPAMKGWHGNFKLTKEQMVDAKVKLGKLDPTDAEKFKKDSNVTLPNGTGIQENKTNRNYTTDQNPDSQNSSETGNEVNSKEVTIVKD